MVEYRFEVPSRFKKRPPKAAALRGGYCQSSKTIFLYGFGCEPLDFDDRFYLHILEHEHIHAVLRRFRIPLAFHHVLLDAIERAKHI
jgi:hypothetical protein